MTLRIRYQYDDLVEIDSGTGPIVCHFYELFATLEEFKRTKILPPPCPTCDGFGLEGIPGDAPRILVPCTMCDGARVSK